MTVEDSLKAALQWCKWRSRQLRRHSQSNVTRRTSDVNVKPSVLTVTWLGPMVLVASRLKLSRDVAARIPACMNTHISPCILDR